MKTALDDKLTPAINWLVHVLVENVGWNEWIKMTPKEQAGFTARTGSKYPYKVVTHPIPDKSTIIDLEQGEYVIECNNEECKKLIIELAKRYKKMEDEYWRISREFKSEHWHKVKTKGPNATPCRMANSGHAGLCSAGLHCCHVTSPILRYITMNGVASGYYKCNNGGTGKDAGKWFVHMNGHQVEHPVTHWRELPPSHPDDNKKYEDIKDQIEVFRKAIGLDDMEDNA